MFGLFESNNDEWKYDELPTPIQGRDYENVRDKVLTKTLKWADSNDGWSHFDVVDGVTLESKAVDKSGITATRGTLKAKCADFNKFINNLYDSSDESKKKIFEDMVSNKVIKNIDENNMVVHSQFKAPTPVYWREFVVLKSKVLLKDGRYAITAISINEKSVPFSKGYVRGVAISAMIVSNNGDGTITLVKVEHLNPKGWLPVALINMMKGKVGKTLAKMPVYL